MLARRPHRTLRVRRVFLFVCGLLAATVTFASAAERPRLEALAVEEAITLDGRLDEPAWATAEVGGGFTLREPRPGERPSEATEVRVVYTKRTLYVGVVAHVEDPGDLVALETQRDGGLFRDESIILLLDTFDDDRNAYWFEWNPLEARTDALVTDEGRDTNFEWDGVWDVATAVGDSAWTAEVAIPFQTLRFDPHAVSWGLNVRRLIRHLNEEAFWAPIPLEASLSRVSLYGELTGIYDVEQGLSLNVKPFLVANASDDETRPGDGSEENFDAGLDVKWGVTRGLSLDLTFNTDFAETEVDDQQVNLTRFSLFFPEKREFFLENAGIFDFGLDGGGLPLLQVFFSRRIGIGPGGEEVPIDWGARLTGRIGPWSVGFLDVATEARDGGPFGVEENNWGAFRIKRNVGRRSSVGVIATSRDGEETSNRVLGADFDWKPNDNLTLGAFAVASDDSEKGTDEAAGAGVSWDGAIWDWAASVVEIGERFDPQMGFLLRRGVRQWEAEVEYSPRPQSELVRNFSVELETEFTTNLDGTTETSEVSLEPFTVRFETEDILIPYATRNFERLFVPFEIVPGVVIPAGDHTFYEYGLRYATNDSRKVAVGGLVQTGEFFDGDRDRVEIVLRLRPNRFVRAETAWEHNDVRLPAGDFKTTIIRQRLGVAWGPRLRADTLVQYNDLADLLGLNFRVNWIYKPGADLFVVYNQSWDSPESGGLSRRDRQVIVKFTYLLQR